MAASTSDGTKKEADPAFGNAEDEGKIFDTTTAKGVENGLFRACMKAIRSAHFKSNRIRAILVVTGLFTDVRVYRDVISIFYFLTAELEDKLEENAAKKDDNIAQQIWNLGYRFTRGYEKDLAYLYKDDKDWKKLARQTLEANPAAVAYLKRLQGMTDSEELSGAAFVLMGALIIGGGAAAMPRVKSRYGDKATHLFQPVAGPGRDQRKRDFIACWDSLAPPDTPGFDTIIASSKDCMQGNNDVLATLARNPWWLYYAIAGTVGIGSIAVALFVRKRQSGS